MGKLIYCAWVLLLLISCRQPEKAGSKNRVTVNQALLDSLKKESDSLYSKPYFASGFTRSEYIINKKDSSITQVMKDSSGMIRQVVITKNKIRIYTAQYYANGQLKGLYKLDKFGQYNGAAEEYFENGFVRESGYYTGGLRTGIWKMYDSGGMYISSTEYDKNGQAIKTFTE